MKTTERGKIFVMYYKAGTILPLEDMYLPLFCGTLPIKDTLGFLKDDTGENISSKNEFYSELTGTFWVWKNTNLPFTGVCHYRRYFTVSPEPWYLKLKYILFHPFKTQVGPNPLIYTKNTKKWIPKILNFDQTRLILDDYDVILPVPRKFRYSIRTHYSKYHDVNDLNILEKIIIKDYPEMADTLQDVLNGNILYGNNMFVMKEARYRDFMQWWFDVLFKFEQSVDLESYKGYQRRILGFIAERTLTLWMIHNNLKIKELQLIYFKKFKKE
ncbi:DUF4422 domain-containing protein [Pelobium manganitolerans]|uniref:DUF4422 domain-containing protein n=1 Tax=Pelobium manganitolerans TaxID=1842495 RepID=UPI0016045297|nr:DUF4422 domain-containing protein [Pelobium manganitolerans]